MVVEARSLATLNILAANPPLYPRNPSQGRHEPLVLYISRVPGTKDVILSTFRPQAKNVTAEDVASSLYYVHQEDVSLPPVVVNGHDREQGQVASPVRPTDPPPPLSQVPPLSPPKPSHAPIRRKPVGGASLPSPQSLSKENIHPGEPRPRLPARPPEPVCLPSSRLTGRFQQSDFPEMPTPRAQLASSHLQAPSTTTHGRRLSADAALAKKPLGPRPMSSSRRDGASESLERLGDDGGVDPTFQVRKPSEDDTAGRTRQPGSGYFPDYDSTIPFALALIRRDPASTLQWNIGRIFSTIQDPLGHRKKAAPASISINICGKGYARFNASRLQANGRPVSSSSVLRSVDVDEEAVFHRDVEGCYGKRKSMDLRKMFRRSHGHSKTEPDLDTVNHLRQGSTASADSTEDDGHFGAVDGNGAPKGHRLKGYDFKSPWGGRCEMRTADGGRVLRCIHFYPEEAGGKAERRSREAVSELRFNLPDNEGSSRRGSSQTQSSLGHFGKLLGPGRGEQDGDDTAVSPFDINLGQEKAGGGTRGKRAKLGKLIVYDEGLKMLDLVVAANIGLWWTSWGVL